MELSDTGEPEHAEEEGEPLCVQEWHKERGDGRHGLKHTYTHNQEEEKKKEKKKPRHKGRRGEQQW